MKNLMWFLIGFASFPLVAYGTIYLLFSLGWIS
jgi:hypothetical protein